MNRIIGILLAGLLGFLGCSDNDGKQSTVTGADKIASFQTKHKPTFDVNEQGQAVWTLMSNDSTNIYLYSNNNTKLIRNTPSIIEDLWIEDNGEISWIESVENGFVIYTYYDGKTTNVPIEDVPNFMNIQMNANGTLLWTGLDAEDSPQIYKYENGSIEQMTSENNNLLPQINDAGDITWIELDEEGVAYINYLSRDGVLYYRINDQKIIIPAENEMPSYFVDMNENGHLVWNGTNDGSNLNQVFLFKDGSMNQITGGVKECVYPQMNDNGDIVYHAFYDNANEIDLFGFGDETRFITRANKYFSLPQINNDGFILWGRLDNNDYSFLIRDENNDIVKTLFESTQGYFDSGLFFANDRYVCFLDGKWVEDEFEYNSLYLFDLHDFHSLTDSILEPFQDEKHALAKTDGLIEPITTVSKARDTIESLSLMPATETIPSRDSAESNEVWSFTVIADTRGLDHATWGARAFADPWNEAGIIWAVQSMHSILQPKPEIVLMNGDMESWMYKTGTTSPFIENLKTWDSFFQKLGRSNVYPIKGNHELFYAKVLAPPHRTVRMQNEYQSVIKAKYPHVWNAESSTVYDKGLFYYFTHQNAFFVVFDSNFMSPTDPPIIGGTDISNVTQGQIDWLRRKVGMSPEYRNAKFRFAICHYTLYPSLERHKANNTRLLELLAQWKFDAVFGACEHLYTDKLNVTINGVTHHMPVVTAGSMAKDSFDSVGSIKNPADFNKIITKVPGFLNVGISGNDIYINFVTPTSYERKAFAGYQTMSTIKIERTAGNPIISDIGVVRPGRHNAIIPNSVPSCDCYHRSGGCYIKIPPGQGTGCHCRNKGIFGCAPDTIVRCQDYLNYYCLHPDTSKYTCLQGGGNCGGY